MGVCCLGFFTLGGKAAAAFASWRVHVVNANKVGKHLRRLLKRTVAKAFGTWRDHTDQAVTSRQKLGRAVRRSVPVRLPFRWGKAAGRPLARANATASSDRAAAEPGGPG